MFRTLIVSTTAIMLAGAAYAGSGHIKTNTHVDANVGVPHYDVDVDVDKKARMKHTMRAEKESAKVREDGESNEKVARYDVDVDIDREGWLGLSTDVNGRYCNSVVDARTNRC